MTICLDVPRTVPVSVSGPDIIINSTAFDSSKYLSLHGKIYVNLSTVFEKLIYKNSV